MGNDGKSRRWLSRSHWKSPGHTPSGELRRLDKEETRKLVKEQLDSAEERDEE